MGTPLRTLDYDAAGYSTFRHHHHQCCPQSFPLQKNRNRPKRGKQPLPLPLGVKYHPQMGGIFYLPPSLPPSLPQDTCSVFAWIHRTRWRRFFTNCKPSSPHTPKWSELTWHRGLWFSLFETQRQSKGRDRKRKGREHDSGQTQAPSFRPLASTVQSKAHLCPSKSKSSSGS